MTSETPASTAGAATTSSTLMIRQLHAGTRQAPPNVVARLVLTDGFRPAALLIIDRCPFCKRQHQHGAGSDPENPSYGGRVSHCLRKPKDGSWDNYRLVPAPEAMAWTA